jgi:hypothetical protein
MTADPDNNYTELNEDNNELIMSVNVVESADYEILSSYISPSVINPEINEEITFSVSYANLGCTGFSPIELYTLVDNTPLNSMFVPYLPSGGFGTVTIPATWSSSVPGTHVFRAIIDYGDMIVEGNELNNEATRAIVVGNAPDYNVLSISASDMTPSIGQMLTLTTSILNEGQSTGSGLLQIIVSDAQGNESVISEQTIAITPGSTVNMNLSWITSDPNSRIIAKVINVMPVEFDFSDNEKQTQLNDLLVSLAATDVLCHGESNGEVTASITGGAGPFVMDWNDPGLEGETINVPAGTYTVNVTDFNGLTASETITVQEPSWLILTESHLDASCDNLSDGSIDLMVEGGTDPYSYSWNNGATSQDISQLDAGSYEVTVTDGHGCSATITVTIANLASATSWYQDADNDGYGNNSVIMISCDQPAGFVGDNTDCNDDNAAVNPGVSEVCNNGIDDNCNGEIDEGCCDITVDAGTDINSYFGIASMQQVSRTAVVTGGTPPFEYSWTIDRPLICNLENAEGDEEFYGGNCIDNNCPATGVPTVNPICSESATITAVLLDTAYVCVTVTDANGCTATDCFIINASDVRCFAGNSWNHKIKICHHTNSQNNPWVEICVDTNAIDAHLAHGDFIGPCQATQMMGLDEEEYFSLNLKLFPNPARELVTLEFNGTDGQSYFIDLTDMTGRRLATFKGKAIHGLNSRQLSLVSMEPGIYLVKLTLDGKQEVKKLMRE